MYVQQVIKDLHSKKVSNLFIKLDIFKAFDTVNWSYLLDIMSFLGFGPRWRGWVASIWATSSSDFLLNGEPGPRIRHRRGVRRDDPLSPMIFPVGHGTSQSPRDRDPWLSSPELC
jgi:hypothetical protein